MRKAIVFSLILISSFLGYLIIPLLVVSLPIKSPLKGAYLAGNLWLPQSGYQAEIGEPQITAKAAYFIDLQNGRVLYQKTPYQKMPIASLAKIMTVIVALENYQMSEVVTISNRAAGMEPDHMLLQPGETLTVEELLYGLFLVSANDAAEALAEHYSTGREGFIDQMNKKSWQLGMNNSKFINPSGLQEEEIEQYSTAYEVALMSRYAVTRFPELTKISSTYHHFIPQSTTHQDYDLYSGINLLTSYPGVIGFKTGYTPEAGLTLVTLAQRGDKQVLGVLLNSENRREEARVLLDYSFKRLGIL